MQGNVTINYDLENSPLQIRTDSVVGSNERVAVNFYNAQGSLAGGIQLFFSSTTMYDLRSCSNSYLSFPTSLPTETDKIWKLTLIRTSDVRLMIHCNNKEVLNVVLSDTTCGYISWNFHWSRDIEKIKFFSSDTASDYYRASKLMNYLADEFTPVGKNLYTVIFSHLTHKVITYY